MFNKIHHNLFFLGPVKPRHGGQFSAPPGPNPRIRPRQLRGRSACDRCGGLESWSPGGESPHFLDLYDI